jgi:hypothetical protein
MMQRAFIFKEILEPFYVTALTKYATGATDMLSKLPTSKYSGVNIISINIIKRF